MACLLSNDQRQALIEYTFVALRENYLEPNYVFKFKDFADEIYKLYTEISSPESALEAISLLPSYVSAFNGALAITDKNTYLNVLKKSKDEINALNDYIISFDENIENIRNFLGLNQDKGKQLKRKRQQLANTVKKEEKKEELSKEHTASVEAKTATPLSVLPFTGKSVNEKTVKTNYETTVNIIKKLREGNYEDSSALGIYFKAISGHILNPEIETLIKSKNLTNKESALNGVLVGEPLSYVVLTDSNGNILLFDTNGELTEETTGEPVYYKMKSSSSLTTLLKLNPLNNVDFNKIITESFYNEESSDSLFSKLENAYSKYNEAAKKTISWERNEEDLKSALLLFKQIFNKNLNELLKANEIADKTKLSEEKKNELITLALEKSLEVLNDYTEITNAINSTHPQNIKRIVSSGETPTLIDNPQEGLVGVVISNSNLSVFTSPQTFTPLSETLERNDFKPEITTTDFTGTAYFKVTGSDERLEIEEAAFDQNKDVIETVLDLFTSELYVYDEEGNVIPMSLEQRKDLIDQFLYTGKEDEQTNTVTWIDFSSQDGVVVFENNDGVENQFTIDTKNWENNKDLRDAIEKRLKSSVIKSRLPISQSKFNEISKSIKNKGLEVVIVETLENAPQGSFLKTKDENDDDVYYLVRKTAINISNDLIENPENFLFPSYIESKGRKVLDIDASRSNYNDFLYNRFSTNVEINPDGTVKYINPTLNLKLSIEGASKVVRRKEELNKRKKNLPPVIKREVPVEPVVSTPTVTTEVEEPFRFKQSFSNSLWRGQESKPIINENGDLVLIPTYDTLFKSEGVSFAENQDMAQTYGERYSKNPYVIEIDESYADTIYPLNREGGTKDYGKRVVGDEREQRFVTKNEIIIPKGKFKIHKKELKVNLSDVKTSVLLERLKNAQYEADIAEFNRYGETGMGYSTEDPILFQEISAELLKRGITKEDLSLLTQRLYDYINETVAEAFRIFRKGYEDVQLVDPESVTQDDIDLFYKKLEEAKNKLQDKGSKSKIEYELVYPTTPTVTTEVKPGVSELFESNPKLTKIGTPEQYSAYLNTIFPNSLANYIVYHGGKIYESLRPNELGLIYFAKDLEYAEVYKKRAKETVEQIKSYTKYALDDYRYLKGAIERAEEYDYENNLLDRIVTYYATDTNEKIEEIVKIIIKDFNPKNSQYILPEYDYERGKIRDFGDEGFDDYEAYEEYMSLSPEEREKLDLAKKEYREKKEKLIEDRINDIYKELEKYQKEKDNSDDIKKLLELEDKYKDVQAEGKLYPVILDVKNPQVTTEEVSNENIKDGKIILDESKDSLIGKDGEFYQRIEGKKIFIQGKDVIAVKKAEQIHELGSKQDIEGFKKFVSGKPTSIVTEEQQAPSVVKTISEPYGVVVVETNLSDQKQIEFVNLIKPQIKAQAVKENKGKNANLMFQFGLRWARVEISANPIQIDSPKVDANAREKEIEKLKSKGKDKTDDYVYAYHTLDQNGNPLPPLSTLQPIIDEIQKATGIDMTYYDAVIGNIYLPGQSIATHRDTTESLSARNYPVVVYTIGAGNAINIYENVKNPGKTSFASDKKVTIPTKAGTIYTFGLNGKGRFELAHDTPTAIQKGDTLEPITLPNGQVIKDYTITLTFRRAKDLKPGDPISPTQQAPITQEQASVTTEVSPRIVVGYQGAKSDIFDEREFNYFTENKNEAKDYGKNVRRVEIDTTGFLIKERTDEKSVKTYYSLIKEFENKTGIRFDILDNSEQGLKNQEQFFKYLKDKGYRGLHVSGYEDDQYLVTFYPESSTPKPGQRKVGFDIKKEAEGTGGATKDPKKADIATDIIEYGRDKGNRVSTSRKYGEAAVRQGIPRNSGVYDKNTVAMVTVSGNNAATEEDLNNTVDRIIEVLKAGGSIVMDNKESRRSSWNISGEEEVFKRFTAALGLVNIENISTDPDYIKVRLKEGIIGAEPVVNLNLPKVDITPGILNKNFEGFTFMEKSYLQRLKNEKITEKQLKDAEEWWNNSPMKGTVPFEIILKAINSSNNGPLASFGVNGMVLYHYFQPDGKVDKSRSGDFTDIYHEAWHAFTTMFLTEQERKSLYDEFRKREGSFVDYQGKHVLYRDAKDWQAEEFLAEEFRRYAMGGGKVIDKTPSPVRNTIFRRILNFLKALFGKTTVEEFVANPMANSKIFEMYDKLYIGDINGFTFDPSKLGPNKVLESPYIAPATDINDRKIWSYQDSILMVKTIDSLISNGIDYLNSVGDDSKNYTAQILRKSLDVTKHIYSDVRWRLENEVLPQLFDDYSKAESQAKALQIKYYIDLVKETIDTFGDPDAIDETLSGEGFLYYHMDKSKTTDVFLEESEIEDDQDPETRALIKAMNNWERNGNETSLRDLASTEIKLLLKSIKKYDTKGYPIKNVLGVSELSNSSSVFFRLAKLLGGTLDKNKMYEKLKAASETDPVIKEVLSKLGKPNTKTMTSNILWTQFWKVFNSSNVKLIQMSVHSEVNTEYSGETTTKYKTTIGTVHDVDKQILNRWNNIFTISEYKVGNKYFRKIENNKAYLDLNSVITEFDKNGNLDPTRIREFLTAIGVDLSYKLPIENYLLRNSTYNEANDLYKNFKLLLNDGVNRVYSIREVFGERSKNSTWTNRAVINKYKFLNELSELETKYSDYGGTFSQKNAEGNTQYEFTLNNTISIIVNTVNSVNSYKELMEHPEMQHLNIKNSPFVNTSLLFEQLFDMKDYKEGGEGKKLAPLELSNLSGAKLIQDMGTDIGIASAKADGVTKLIMDLHLTLRGRQELMRHADKGTSFTVYIKGKGLIYIDYNDFKIPNQSYNNTKSHLYNRYLKAEFERIKKLQELEKQSKKSKILYDPAYLRNGQRFHIFETVLDAETKKEILKFEKFEDIPATLKNEKIYPAITKYFNEQVKDVKNRFGKDLFIDDQIINQVKNDTGIGDVNAVKDIILKSFVVNNWIHNVETLSLIYGDLALYNHEKEEFHKRNAGAGSTGTLFASDKDSIEYALSKGMGYAEFLRSQDAEAYKTKYVPINNDGSYNSAVFEDPETQSIYYDEYFERFEIDLIERNKEKIDSLKTEEEKKKFKESLTEKAKKAFKAYTEMKEGDGQGWITFDAYRAFSILEGNWSNEQDKVYKRIAGGEKIGTDKIAEFFPPRKFQYWGPLKTEEGVPPLMGFHKFSLVPLIPTMIEGSNLEKLHKKMIKENIAYSLFKSGSKVSNVVEINKGKVIKDTFTGVEENRVFDDSKEYTKNTLYLHFLKNQLEIAPTFKGVATFPTQMRKLVFNGLMEVGIPVDFEMGLPLSERIKLWDSIKTDAEKRNASKFYNIIREFEDNIDKLSNILKKELEEKVVIEYETPGDKTSPVILTEKLKEFILSELDRQDLGDHELDFLKTSPTGKVVFDLSFSISSDKLDKVLNKIVTKRLVNQKFTGEGLIQVSGAGFESSTLRGKLTPEEQKKYGTNGLSFYTADFTVDENGKKVYGKTKAMKVKIALQGGFRSLLHLKHNDGNKIENLDRLNDMIKNEEWLNKDNHRNMITITGPRIPVQGLNSMEFAEVYEFLDESAGNVVVLPAEIVAKSGGDFDIDKLTFMFPNLETYPDRAYWLTEEGSQKLKKLEQILNSQGVDIKLTKDLVSKIITEKRSNLSKEEKKVFDFLVKEGPKNVRYDTSDKTVEGLQNRIQMNMKEMLSFPENFNALVRPNDTDILKPIADDASEFGQKKNYRTETDEYSGKKRISSTNILEIGYNLDKHQQNKIGKDTLGLGAVDNTYNSLFNRIGMRLNHSYSAKFGEDKVQIIQRMYLPHNQLKDEEGNDVISLSHIYDATNEHNIADVISQMINGWVDVAKDAWIFNIQGNKEISPTLLFMIQAGVPVRQAVMLASHPLVKEYVDIQNKYRSTFAEPLGYYIQNPNFAQFQARDEMMRSLFPEYIESFDKDDKGKSKYNSTFTNGTIYKMSEKYLHSGKVANKIFSQKLVTKKDKGKDVTRTSFEDFIVESQSRKGDYTNEDKAVFLHFLEVENMANAVKDVKLNTNFDTKPTNKAFEVINAKNKYNKLLSSSKIPKTIISKLVNETLLNSFAIQDFQKKLFGGLFRYKYDNPVYEYLETLTALEEEEEKEELKFENQEKPKGKKPVKITSRRLRKLFNSEEDFIETLYNDFIIFNFQNIVNEFNIDKVLRTGYRGSSIVSDPEIFNKVLKVDKLTTGVYVREENGQPVIYVDKAQLEKQFLILKTTENPFIQRKLKLPDGTTILLAPLRPMAFESKDDYFSFVFEREMLRYRYRKDANGLERLKSRADFAVKRQAAETQFPMTEGESESDFNKRIEIFTYDLMLRDMALDNVYNPWKMFNALGRETYASQFQNLITTYGKDLTKHYSLFDYIEISTSSKNDKDVMSNLYLNNTMLEQEEINNLNQNLLELSNPAAIKIDREISDEERIRIAEFFSRFPIYAFFQSGMNTTSSFSLTRIAPQDKINFILRTIDDRFKKEQPLKQNDKIQVFLSMFETVNKKKDSFRFKDYKLSETEKYDIFNAVENLEERLRRNDKGDWEILSFEKLLKTEAINLANSNPDKVFVVDGTINRDDSKNYVNELLFASDDVLNNTSNVVPVSTMFGADIKKANNALRDVTVSEAEKEEYELSEAEKIALNTNTSIVKYQYDGKVFEVLVVNNIGVDVIGVEKLGVKGQMLKSFNENPNVDPKTDKNYNEGEPKGIQLESSLSKEEISPDLMDYIRQVGLSDDEYKLVSVKNENNFSEQVLINLKYYPVKMKAGYNIDVYVKTLIKNVFYKIRAKKINVPGYESINFVLEQERGNLIYEQSTGLRVSSQKTRTQKEAIEDLLFRLKTVDINRVINDANKSDSLKLNNPNTVISDINLTSKAVLNDLRVDAPKLDAVSSRRLAVVNKIIGYANLIRKENKGELANQMINDLKMVSASDGFIGDNSPDVNEIDPTVTMFYKISWDQAANKNFGNMKSIMISGNTKTTSARKGNRLLSNEELKNHFENFYLPLITKAIDQGVKVFNVGNNSGIEALVKEYFTENGFKVTSKEGYKSFELVTQPMSFDNQNNPFVSVNGMTISPRVRRAIDAAIFNLKDQINSGKEVVMPAQGIGQYLIGADPKTGILNKDAKQIAPQTFLYLSQRLAELGIRNNNFNQASGVSSEEIVKQNKAVTDEEVLEAMMCLFGIGK